MEIAIQQALNALSLGGTYALLALGLAVVFSVLGMINFAHGELMTIAGYTLYFSIVAGLPLWISVPAALMKSSMATNSHPTPKRGTSRRSRRDRRGLAGRSIGRDRSSPSAMVS